jgi:LuxR family maltose regulon positive regulatory protein
MSTALLVTKLRVPPLPPHPVPRPRLIERLNAGLTRKLILVSAPPGFGKTTLLAEWIHTLTPAPASPSLPMIGERGSEAGVGVRAAWLSLDEGDNDPARFLTYLVAAAQTIEPGIGATILPLLQSPEPPQIEVMLSALINDLAALAAPCLLALDDYHLIQAPAIHRAVAFLLKHLPPQLHLAIATRADPPLPLSRLRARDHMIELRLSDLRFTPEEVEAFLNQAMRLGISSDDANVLAARTEGWITGLQMAALSMQSRLDKSIFIASFSGSHAYIADYLTDEVLDQQPEPLKSFLLQTSILDRLTGPLCNAVTGRMDGQGTLEQLTEANLFLVPLDDERCWYRYHRLFADLLRKRLQQTQPDCLPDLHRRASAWHERNGFAAEAIDHALAAEDFERAADLAERSATTFWQRGEFATYQKLLESIPQDVMHTHARLCVYHAALLLLGGRSLATVESLLQVATDLGPTDELRGEIATLRAGLDMFKGDASHGIRLCEQALALLPADNWLRGLAVRTLSVLYLLKGDAATAGRFLEENIQASRRAGDVIGLSASLRRLGSVCMLQGQLRRAREFYQRSVDVCTGAPGRPWSVAGRALVHLGELAYEWNDLTASARYLSQALDWLAKSIPGWGLLGHIVMAQVKQAQGDGDGAQQQMETARQLAVESDTELDDVLVEAHAARLALAQGNLGAALRWAQARRANAASAVSRPAKDAESLIRSELMLEIEQTILARVYVASGQAGEALTILKAVLEAAEKRGRTGSLIRLLAVQALALTAQGERESAAQALGRALTLAEPEGYVRTFVDEGDPMRMLIADCRWQMAKSAHRAPGTSWSGMPDYLDRLMAAFGQPPAISQSATMSHLPSAISQMVEPLSERELEVLRLIAEGLSNQEVAQRLFLSVPTVKWHTTHIYGKLGVTNRTQAVAQARALGLLKT